MELQEKTGTLLFDFLVKMGLSPDIAMYVKLLILLLLLSIVAYVVDMVVRKVLVSALHTFAAKSKTSLDDHMVESNAPRYLGHVLPTVLVYIAIPLVFIDFPNLIPYVIEVIDIYLIILIVLLIRALARGIKNFSKTTESFRDKPVDSYLQVFNLILYFIGGVLVFSELTGKDVWSFFTAIGAASAILLLIFRDTIMGFVASIQMSSFDMVRVGDWITMENYGADGDVIEINLNTVKVQNFDKTITTIPTYSLISTSFKNWRGMEDSTGRRIKRAATISQRSVRFLDKDELPKFQNIQYLTNYIADRQADIDQHNERVGANKELLLNGRNLTNLGLFRKYLNEYLANHPALNKDMTMMVRQLAPTDKGIPLEIYAFSSDKRWVNYEYIMADIFDHIIASVSYFDLELFESPSSADLDGLGKR